MLPFKEGKKRLALKFSALRMCRLYKALADDEEGHFLPLDAHARVLCAVGTTPRAPGVPQLAGIRAGGVRGRGGGG